ncbi:transcriptional regulator with XRE-family HTH domain [Nonomuraea thailandensis]|uniref:Transcriptional regulator with XRE-family HTH domain n=1 Tax=Nonomuraea thailandensis TaxID=1188745 RepID=A0A9X2GR29_9ACTN|nr:helix-turn-helix domain-containing protein [Nonomuraea thailandensis]MCP2360151.1 transcriptional regulator with XRE-family HTH domain [Nonomuraea thailandensis]
MDLGELGAFLKSRRDRLAPRAVGLPPGTRRRVPGLRRDEVAELASLSADYYTELEQGRGQCPSEPVLHALARALRLDPDETAHLFHLAGHPTPLGAEPVRMQEALRRLMDRLQDTPAMVITDLHEVVVQNHAAQVLVDHLMGASAEFAGLWRAREVKVRHEEYKRVVNPALGVLKVTCNSIVTADAAQRLLWFVPDDADAVPKLHALDAAEVWHDTPGPAFGLFRSWG